MTTREHQRQRDEHFDSILLPYSEVFMEQVLVCETGLENNHIEVFDYVMTAIEHQFCNPSDFKAFHVKIDDRDGGKEESLVVAVTEVHAIFVAATNSESYLRECLLDGSLGSLVLREDCTATEEPQLKEYAEKWSENYVIEDEAILRLAGWRFDGDTGCPVCDHVQAEPFESCPECGENEEKFTVHAD